MTVSGIGLSEAQVLASEEVNKLRLKSEELSGVTREEFVSKFSKIAFTNRTRVAKGLSSDLWVGSNPARDMAIGLLYNQYVLDKFIEDNLRESDSEFKVTSLDISVALKVEVSELVNETKSFKFWSTKEPVRSKVLDESADVLHFMISRALRSFIDRGALSEMIHPVELNSLLWVASSATELIDLVELLLSLDQEGIRSTKYSKLEVLESSHQATKYVSSRSIIDLFRVLNIDLITVLSIYEVKHNINYERQLNNY